MKIEEKNGKEFIIGIDDAGRGCLIGNMCLAGCLMDRGIEKEFKDLGIKDSKLLSPKQREELVNTIKEKVKSYVVHMATPVEIDTGFGEGLNLNQVEALLAGKIINDLSAKLSKEEETNLKIILDCPSINTSGWKNQLMSYVKDKKLEPKIACEHKADFNHVVVSAASILAKVTRDAEIEKLKQKYNVDFGSGYPADPEVKKFLEENVDNPRFEGLFRKSWQTFKTALEKKRENKSSRQRSLF